MSCRKHSTHSVHVVPCKINTTSTRKTLLHHVRSRRSSAVAVQLKQVGTGGAFISDSIVLGFERLLNPLNVRYMMDVPATQLIMPCGEEQPFGQQPVEFAAADDASASPPLAMVCLDLAMSTYLNTTNCSQQGAAPEPSDALPAAGQTQEPAAQEALRRAEYGASDDAVYNLASGAEAVTLVLMVFSRTCLCHTHRLPTMAMRW